MLFVEKVKIRINNSLRLVSINNLMFCEFLVRILLLTIVMRIKIQIVRRIRFEDKGSINTRLVDKGAKKIELVSFKRKRNLIVIKTMILVCFIKFDGRVNIISVIIIVFNILGHLGL